MLLTTTPMLKAELSIADGSQDTYLSALIAQQSAVVEGYCGRCFDPPAETTHTIRLGRPLPRIALPRAPVTAVAEVAVNGTILDPASYELESAEFGVLLRVSTSGREMDWPCGIVRVRCTAGFAVVPPDVERVCLDLCVMAYQSRGRDRTLRSEKVLDVIDQSWFDPDKTEMRGGLPGDIAGRLDPWRLGGF